MLFAIAAMGCGARQQPNLTGTWYLDRGNTTGLGKDIHSELILSPDHTFRATTWPVELAPGRRAFDAGTYRVNGYELVVETTTPVAGPPRWTLKNNRIYRPFAGGVIVYSK